MRHGEDGSRGVQGRAHDEGNALGVCERSAAYCPWEGVTTRKGRGGQGQGQGQAGWTRRPGHREVGGAPGSLRVTLLTRRPGGGCSHLHPGSDDVHGVGEDRRGGCGQGPGDGLKDDVRALLRAEVRQLLWNRGRDSDVPSHVPSRCFYSLAQQGPSPSSATVTPILSFLCFLLN